MSPHMNKVFSIVRKIYVRSSTNQLKEICANNAIWEIFMGVTLQVASYHNQDHSENIGNYQESNAKNRETIIPGDGTID